jgi:hypothetical protein
MKELRKQTHNTDVVSSTPFHRNNPLLIRVITVNKFSSDIIPEVEPSAWKYNSGALFLGDINTGAWHSRLGESRI